MVHETIECHYYDIHTAIASTFLNNNFAILMLQGYMITLMKQQNHFYLFNLYARDGNGMPNPDGTAVVMKFATASELEQHLYSH